VSQVPEESVVYSKIKAVPRRASRSYAVSGASLTGSGAEEMRRNREKRHQQEKRRQEQADQTMAEKLQQEEDVRVATVRRRLEGRRHMDMYRSHQFREQGRQGRVDIALAQRLQTDKRDLRDADGYWYNGSLPANYYPHCVGRGLQQRSITMKIWLWP
jgi:exonuclease VII large subunit